MTDGDLYDDARAPGSRWTRVNIGEAIPGVPTPLTWSLWRPAMEHGFWWAQEQLGVVGRHEPRPRVTGIALGRPAVSVDVSLGQVARLPGYDADAFAEQYFGLPPAAPDDVPALSGDARGPLGAQEAGVASGGDVPALPGDARRLLGAQEAGVGRRRRVDQARDVARIAGRGPVALATVGRRTRANAAGSDAWWRAVTSGAPQAEPVALLTEAARRFQQAMAIHTLQGIVCQGAYERAGALAEDLAPLVVSADGDLAEARLAADLWAVAHGELAEAAFLAEHGFHGPEEGELAARSWREDPGPVRAAAAAWAEADPDRAPAAAAARRSAERAAAEAELLARLPRARRGAARALLRTASRLVVQREVGKAAFLRYLDVARVATRRLGEDAPWCTLEELQRGHRPRAGELDERRRRREALLALELPLSWVGDPEPLVVPGSVARSDGGSPLAAATLVAGLGASPGVVQGRARVVTDPSSVLEPIGPDEVLVTRTTDPSWVTLFLTAGALVIDVGGALSHGAIIARELGIPCVIGTGDGSARIPDGAPVTVDGTAGTVTVG